MRYRLVPVLVFLVCRLPLVAWAGEVPEPISFVDDVLPVLSKAGCSGSACHSKPAGQNGFKLSVFAYDPEADYAAIVHDRQGRRLSLNAPEQSLLLLKATQAVPHEGAQRFPVDSEAYAIVRQWIAEGAVYAHPDDAPLESISLSPDKVTSTNGDAEVAFEVIAHYANGRTRTVTQLASFETNKEAIVEIGSDGLARLSDRPGEAIVVAQFLGEVATARVMIPRSTSNHLKTQLASKPRANFIDTLAYQRFEELGIEPSPRCSDSTFLRRVSLDLIGRLPEPEEVRAFLQDHAPDKRATLVDRLLESPLYADHWAVKWADLLRPNPDRAGVKSVYVLDQWLRKVFRENWSMDRFAREVLTAQGSTHRHGPTVVYRDRRTPEDLTSMISQVFLGVRLECARCHHHPNEKWSQEDYYQMAGFFAQLKRKGKGVSPPISGGWEVFYHAPGGTVKHPVTNVALPPKAPDGPLMPADLNGADPRAWFAKWLTEPHNPFFAKAIVNRVWGELMGRGIVHPVDDFRETNPPSNPELLDALAEHFAALSFDHKKLLRLVVMSELYQQDSLPTASNRGDLENFSRSYRRRLPAEVLADALADITQIPNTFEGLAEGSRATQVWNFKIASDTLDAFGRPDSSSDCPCERNLSTSVVQALHLMNAESLQAKLSASAGRVAALTESARTPESIIEELYLLAYSRYPSPAERALALAEFQREGSDRQTATEDILWALLNSAEFVFNH